MHALIDFNNIFFADIVTLPVQIIDLAVNSHALNEKKASETSEKLRKLAEELQTQVNNIKKHIESLQLPMDVE